MRYVRVTFSWLNARPRRRVVGDCFLLPDRLDECVGGDEPVFIPQEHGAILFSRAVVAGAERHGLLGARNQRCQAGHRKEKGKQGSVSEIGWSMKTRAHK